MIDNYKLISNKVDELININNNSKYINNEKNHNNYKSSLNKFKVNKNKYYFNNRIITNEISNLKKYIGYLKNLELTKYRIKIRKNNQNVHIDNETLKVLYAINNIFIETPDEYINKALKPKDLEFCKKIFARYNIN